MNLIDLYNENPNCKVQRISDNGYIIPINFASYTSFSEALNCSCHSDVSNTADDWEMVKQKKIFSLIYHAGDHINITKNNTKVVLTWEE